MAHVTPLARPLDARQELHIITQTITWPYTTFTTHVTLGTIAAQTEAPAATSSHDDNNLTNTQIGAIVGSVLGVFLLVLLFIFCCLRRRRVKIVSVPKSYRSSYSSYESRRASYVEPVAVEPVVMVEPLPPRRPPMGYFQEGFRRERPRRSRHRREGYMQGPPVPQGPYTRPVPDPYAPVPSYAPPPAERIPGAPKNPTYRALPIPKPNPVRKF